MDHLYIVLFVLLTLAAVDLVVGVSNDAVNFLNSAIGSRVTKRKYIYVIAAIGIIIGSMSSSGMMEVARKGVFYPENFYLSQLLIIFLAVMITDIILVDIFNTLGFPTSTTIAIVFELIGAAFAMGLIIISGNNPNSLEIDDLINTHSAIVILAGIFLSIIMAFVSGAIIQFVARVLFTFRYKGRFKFLFSVAGAISITSIFFLLLKKEITFLNFLYGVADDFIADHLQLVLVSIFTLSFSVFYSLAFLFNANIPRFVVFFGTFALALSFAANDLVNFIGVPLAGFEGVKAFIDSGASEPSTFLMNIWGEGVLNNVLGSEKVYQLVYLISGLIMAITLFYSHKARSVTETEIYLGRQESGYEPFEPSHLSRVLVRNFLTFYHRIKEVSPPKVVEFISGRYSGENVLEENGDSDDIVYFDTVRASVNLVVASILITVGTYLQVPLSTTFVVFMVAMGTSLSDQAWGRESAVYRISGVLSILGGWFVTASMAFVGAFVIAVFIWWAELYAVTILVILVGYVLFRTGKYHKKVREERIELKKEKKEEKITNIEKLVDLGSEKIRKHILETSKIFMLTMQGFVDENIKQLRDTCDKTNFLEKVSKNTKEELFNNFSNVNMESFDSGHFFIQALDYLGECTNTLNQIVKPIYKHLENQHKGLSNSQKEDILLLLEEVTGLFNYLVHIEKEHRFENVPEMVEKQKYLIELIEDLRKKQIKRIMNGVGKTRSSILLLECYAESKNLVLYTINLLKSHRDFYTNLRG
ncbi:inorganic phosphate transporter [Labilibacter sediminis]|nr:inorganic phosphate transporter [Labilibacter sediminis]